MNYWDIQTLHHIREGYYSAQYFNRAKEILTKEKSITSATMQIFQRNNAAILCGIGEVAELIKHATGYWRGGQWVDCSDKVHVNALCDGDVVHEKEPVMHITGPYMYFAHLESLYLGILARRTLVATNTHRVVQAALGKPVMFFADRFDHFLNQEGDGYAANIGGAAGVCTPAHCRWLNIKPTGTIPHALIAVNGGDTVKAARLFAKYFPKIPLIALVDYENDCVNTAIAVADALGDRLWGVRLDTSSDVVDVSLKNKRQFGVTPSLVSLVRSALSQKGHAQVKIVVSGGFTSEKINLYEQKHTPVDVYGVGSSLLKGTNDFTADIVLVDNKPQVKIGRAYQINTRMKVMR